MYIFFGVKENILYVMIFNCVLGGYVMIMTCLKIFKLPDAIIGILSTVGIVISQFVFAFAISGWMMYLGKNQFCTLSMHNLVLI